MGFFDLFRRKDTKEKARITEEVIQPQKDMELERDVEPEKDEGSSDIDANIPITVESSLRSINVEYKLSQNCDVSRLSLGGYSSPSGGYVNWAIFDISGINQSTKRRNKRRIVAADEGEALDAARADGLVDPEILSVIPHDTPTDRQISYALDLGAAIPEGACKEDVSAILSRILDGEIVSERRIADDSELRETSPTDGPSEEFAMFAHDNKIHFSKFIEADALFNTVVYGLEGREKAAFYAYSILKNRAGVDVATDPVYPDLIGFYQFADMAMGSDSIMRSINERSPDDYRHPHKGSTAYKAVAAFFMGDSSADGEKTTQKV